MLTTLTADCTFRKQKYKQKQCSFKPIIAKLPSISHSPKFDKITNEENMKNESLNKALK